VRARFRVTNTRPLTDVAERAVEIPMLEIWRDARFAAPVDTGNLAQSITPEGPFVTGPGKAEGFVGTNVEYAPYVEFGTRFGRAQPFLGPALAKARRRFG
jgi:hypothetical protein